MATAVGHGVLRGGLALKNQSVLYGEIIAVCSEIHKKHINTLCRQKVKLLNVEPVGIYSNHWALQRVKIGRTTTV